MWPLNAISLCETHLHSVCRFKVLMRIEPMNNCGEIARECSIDVIVHRHKGLRHRYTYKTSSAYNCGEIAGECSIDIIVRRHKGLRHKHTYKTSSAYKPNLKNECFAATTARYAGLI